MTIGKGAKPFIFAASLCAYATEGRTNDGTKKRVRKEERELQKKGLVGNCLKF